MQSKNHLFVIGGALFLVVGLLYWAIMVRFSQLAGVLMGVGGVMLLVFVYQNIGYLIEKLTGRTAYEGVNMAVGIVVCLIIAVIVYMFLDRYSTRFDFTEAKKYTLSDFTVKLLRQLDEPIHLQYLATMQDPPHETERIRNLLDLYRRYSNQLSFEVVDPQREPHKVEELAPVTLGSVYVRHGGQHERVSPVNENTLTNAIIKIARGEARVIYFTAGHDEAHIDDMSNDGMAGMSSMLRDDGYRVESIELFRFDRVPDDAAAIVIAGPRRPFLDSEIETVREYLNRGGAALFLIDPAYETRLEETGLESMLYEEFGVDLGNNLVLEFNPLARMFGGDPSAPLLAQVENHPITEPYQFSAPAISFPLTRSVEAARIPPPGVDVTELILTSRDSWAETDLESLRQTGSAQFDEGQDRMGPISIAAAATKPALDLDEDETQEAELDPLEALAREAREALEAEEEDEFHFDEARVVVFGDSGFARNARYRFSIDLFVNAVNWLTEQDDLIAIRARDDSGQPITVTQVQGRMVFYMSLVILPGFVAILGAVVVITRKLRG